MMVKWGGVSYNRIINEIRYDYWQSNAYGGHMQIYLSTLTELDYDKSLNSIEESLMIILKRVGKHVRK